MARISLSTGSEDLNSFIHGYPIKGITAIYGEPATGKTTMALLAAIEQIKNHKKVLFIDAENSFSIDRAKQLFPDVEKYLENLIKIHPANFSEQEKIIQNLPIKNISLIIIDTISFHYRIASKENQKTTNESLIKQIETLKKIGEDNNISIILTNQVYIGPDNQTKIVSGKILSKNSKLLIKLLRTPRTLVIEYPEIENNKLLFEIKNEGIIKTK